MKAGVASPNGVVIQDVPEPKPKATDLLVRIKAIALNRAARAMGFEHHMAVPNEQVESLKSRAREIQSGIASHISQHRIAA